MVQILRLLEIISRFGINLNINSQSSTTVRHHTSCSIKNIGLYHNNWEVQNPLMIFEVPHLSILSFGCCSMGLQVIVIVATASFWGVTSFPELPLHAVMPLIQLCVEVLLFSLGEEKQGIATWANMLWGIAPSRWR